MYASLFDLDANSFDDSCSVSYTEAYNAIKRYMLANSFTWIQGNLYFAELIPHITPLLYTSLTFSILNIVS